VSTTVVISAPTAEAMEDLGSTLAGAGERGQRIYLRGPLAAGKTTFARGYLRGLGHAGAVKSPTFTLVESYRACGAEVHHFDLYRLSDPEELEFIGIDDYLDSGADILIEWAERGCGVLPHADIEVEITLHGAGRSVRIEGDAAKVEKILKSYKTNS